MTAADLFPWFFAGVIAGAIRRWSAVLLTTFRTERG